MTGPGGDVLARASAALADTLDLEITLTTVARLAVPGIADSCAMHLLDSGDQRQLAKPIDHTPLVAAIVALVRDRIRS